MAAARQACDKRSSRANKCKRADRAQSRLHLFRRHVFRSADNAARGRAAGRGNIREALTDDLSQTKIAHLHKTVARQRAVLAPPLHDKDIRRLEIAVKNSFIV